MLVRRFMSHLSEFSYTPKEIFTRIIYKQTLASMSSRGSTFSALYTYKTRTSTKFVKKSVKMYSVACQKVHVAFFRIQLYTQRNITIGFTNMNEKWFRFLAEYFPSYIRCLQGFSAVQFFVHTYIHNWPLQPFSQDYWPSFLCCVC